MTLVTQMTSAMTAIGAFCKRLKEVRVQLAAAQAFNTTTLVDVTGFTFNTVANRKYVVKVWSNYNASNVATGIAQGYSITGTSNVWARYRVTTSTAGADLARDFYNNPASFIATASPATTGNTTVTEFRIETTTAGTFRYRVASETNGQTITLQTSSVFTVTELP